MEPTYRIGEAEWNGVRCIALAQFSLARARDAVAARTGLPVLTTVHSAVARLQQRLAAGSR